MTWTEYSDKVHRMNWLIDMAESYKHHIELINKEEKSYSIYGIQFAMRSEPQLFSVNSNYFPSHCIKEGLQEAVDKITEEINTIMDEIRETTVTYK